MHMKYSAAPVNRRSFGLNKSCVAACLTGTNEDGVIINVDIAGRPHSNKFANASAPFNHLISRFHVVILNHAKETCTVYK